MSETGTHKMSNKLRLVGHGSNAEIKITSDGLISGPLSASLGDFSGFSESQYSKEKKEELKNYARELWNQANRRRVGVASHTIIFCKNSTCKYERVDMNRAKHGICGCGGQLYLRKKLDFDYQRVDVTFTANLSEGARSFNSTVQIGWYDC
jgi:hypothetical protein